MKKKRLLVFCPGYPSSDRPTNGIFTQRSVSALTEKYEIEVVHLRAVMFGRKLISSECIDGITVRRISVIQLPNFGAKLLILINAYVYASILPKLFLKGYLESFDFFHSTMLFPTSLVVAKLAKILGKPHIAQGIGNDINKNLPGLINNKWVRSRFRFIDCFQLNSNALEVKLNMEFPERADSFVVHRGVDLALFSLKKEQEVRKVGVRFLFLGGVQDTKNVFSDKNFKGIHVLLEAWSFVENEIGNAHLTIGGPGSTREIFQDWIATLAYPEKITIIESILPKDVPQILKANEVVLIPSLSEGLPNLANEAQATGTVVVASKVGGIPVTVVDGYSGFLFPVGDSKALAKSLLKLVQPTKDLFAIGLNGRKNMEDHFSWQNYVEAIDRKFKEIE